MNVLSRPFVVERVAPAAPIAPAVDAATLPAKHAQLDDGDGGHGRD